MLPNHTFPLGDQAIVLNFGEKIDPAINQKVHEAYAILESIQDGSILEMVPTYHSLTIYFDSKNCSYAEMKKKIIGILEKYSGSLKASQPRVISIPVVYGGEFGPDLGRVAEYNELSEQQVIQIHSSTVYPIYMIGFLPGFPYLGGMSSEISTPRLDQPRGLVKSGSVGIAGAQTGIYPIDSPGGWNIIGRTPLKLFQPEQPSPFLCEVGDKIQFKPICFEEFYQWKEGES
ncbi:5-oxoprolinase subunit PxpB [Bacillaceae bacterium S4-13-56]